MSHEASAQEHLDEAGRYELDATDWSYDIQAAQVHATLALVEEVRRLVRVLVEKERK